MSEGRLHPALAVRLLDAFDAYETEWKDMAVRLFPQCFGPFLP